MSLPFQSSDPPTNQTQGHRKYADRKQRQGVRETDGKKAHS